VDPSPPRRCRRPPGREVMNLTASEVIEEVSAWALGGGVLTFGLFPFALPILLLTVAFVLPFVLAGLAIVLVLAVVAAPILLVRRLRSAWNGRPSGSHPPNASAALAVIAERHGRRRAH
jgi:hypothetical protein